MRQATQQPLLTDRKVLVRGVTTLVCEGQDSVLKLTVDKIAYELAKAQVQWACSGMPGTYQLFGQVGLTSEGNQRQTAP